MEYTDYQRVKKVVNWLIFKLDLDSSKDLSSKINYNYSYFSQFCSGSTPLTEKFVSALCSLDENLNNIWILTGEGSMFKNVFFDCENCKKLEDTIENLKYTISLQKSIIESQKKNSTNINSVENGKQ